MSIKLIILLYYLIGIIVEFLLLVGVWIYVKKHSNSDNQFIEVWNKVSNLLIITSLSRTVNINKDIASTFLIHICTWTFIWPIHIFINILIIIGTYVLVLIKR